MLKLTIMELAVLRNLLSIYIAEASNYTSDIHLEAAESIKSKITEELSDYDNEEIERLLNDSI